MYPYTDQTQGDHHGCVAGTLRVRLACLREDDAANSRPTGPKRARPELCPPKHWSRGVPDVVVSIAIERVLQFTLPRDNFY